MSATDTHDMLLVLAGNDRAVTFYERHGLSVERRVPGLDYYGERMGVTLPQGAQPFDPFLMRR
jgi:ribosomal protein S18 acetylase RimI-like enzyme